MSEPPAKGESVVTTTQTGWWARKSKVTKILLIVVPALIIIGLAVGLGVGLTVGRDNGDDEDNGPGPNAPTPTSGAFPEGLWAPQVNTTWQIILSNPIELASDATSVDPDVEAYDIDLFTNDEEVFSTLRRLGKRSICYFSAGSYEPYRPDSADFQDSDKGKELDGWPGEYWLDVNSENVRNIMTKRIELAHSKGCDAIDPDNVDGYDNENGIGLTADDSINYLNFMFNIANPLNLSMGLKNAAAIIPNVLNITHFTVNEQCVQYQECGDYSAYVNDSKPVFHIEYPDDVAGISFTKRDDICGHTGDASGSEGFSTVLKNMNLNGFVEYCSGMKADTPLNMTNTGD